VALARLGVGANIGDAAATVRRAIVALARLGTVVRSSSLYSTKAWGVEGQDDFVNAAVLLDTQLEPHGLLQALQAIEEELGRRPTFRWGPRVIDLDILAYDDLRIDEPDLVVPHRDLLRRAFALVPLAEIDPGYENALEALPERDREAVRPISSPWPP
jgi:2-amino-4-hydroxy-6-hydroxymethyldihydropteridine diphosphokinase